MLEEEWRDLHLPAVPELTRGSVRFLGLTRLGPEPDRPVSVAVAQLVEVAQPEVQHVGYSSLAGRVLMVAQLVLLASPAAVC